MNSFDIFFVWDIHYFSTYDVPYRWYYIAQEEPSKFNRYFSIEKLEKIWDKLYKKYGSLKIEITGGEPLSYPNIIELINMLSRKHSIKVVSDLSVPSIVSDFAARLNPERVEVDMNFHPQFAELDRFIRKALLLKLRGFKNTAYVCAYPPFLGYLDYYRKRFEDKGLNFSFLPFIGMYEGKKYPESYTQRERAMILHACFFQERFKYLLNKTRVKGKLCSAGLNYAVIKPNGDVFRCRGYFKRKKLFNIIFDEDFTLYSQTQSCNMVFCPAGEYKGL